MCVSLILKFILYLKWVIFIVVFNVKNVKTDMLNNFVGFQKYKEW